MLNVTAYAASKPGAEFKKMRYQLGTLDDEHVDIKIQYCGLCHSDLSMHKNDWGNTQFPFVPGHEIIGEVCATGKTVKHLKVGDKVGLGWFCESCMHCQNCMQGDHHLCRQNEQTIVGRYGGFADYTRCHWSWAIKLPKKIDLAKAGPLLCGGITVFNPIILAGVKPTDKVGVIGIGGLGHMAIKFLNKWGCEVVAFSSNLDKKQQILDMGATSVYSSKEVQSLANLKGELDFILNTTNVNLDWSAFLSVLNSKGTLHHVGAILEPMAIPAMSLLGGQKSISASPLGSPATTKTMLDFCVRHDIYPTIETFKMSEVNEAMAHLEASKARFRVVLEA